MKKVLLLKLVKASDGSKIGGCGGPVKTDKIRYKKYQVQFFLARLLTTFLAERPRFCLVTS